MEPLTVILWALCLGLAWLEFAGMTGAGEAQGGTNRREGTGQAAAVR